MTSGDPHHETIGRYDAGADDWIDERAPNHEGIDGFLALLEDPSGATGVVGGPVVDLGCGPGWALPRLPAGSVALDAAMSMLEAVPDHAAGAPRVAADLRALPFRRGALRGAWADRSYVHVHLDRMPLALWDLHRALVPGAPAFLRLFGVPNGPEPAPSSQHLPTRRKKLDGLASVVEDRPTSPGHDSSQEHVRVDAGPVPGRWFSAWSDQRLADVILGAGFDTVSVERTGRPRAQDPVDSIALTLRRARTLADTVGPDMDMLLVGLNPSLAAADSGVGFVTATNRGWPALRAAGLATIDRDPLDLLRRHRIGMTDLVKRATARAGELRRCEYRDGLRRLERLCGWLQPGVVVVLGVTGWRAATAEPAELGTQAMTLAGRPVYVMPNPSGANVHTSVEDLVDHLHAASRLASDLHGPR